MPEVTDALLRLGSLADEVQELVDGLVEELLARCVTIEGRGRREDRAGRIGRSARYLVRELLMALWRRQGWPLQAMAWQKWEELGELALSAWRRCDGSFPAASWWKLPEGQCGSSISNAA